MAQSRYQQASSGFIGVATARGRAASDTPDINPDTNIKPVAQVTDTYVHPAPVPRSPLFELAESLQHFEASLGPIIAKEKQKQDEDDAVQGQAAFMKANEQGYAEAVRTGAIPPNASPIFVKAYKQMEGRRLARDTEGSLIQSYASSPVKDDDAPDAYSNWVGPQVRNALDGVTDPDVLRGAMPGISNAVSAMGRTHAQDVGARIMQKAVSGVRSDITGSIASSVAPASGPPQITGEHGKYDHYAGLVAKIDEAVTNGRAIGIPEDQLTDAAASSLISAATEGNDTDLLDQLPPGLRDRPGMAERLQKAREDIITKAATDEQQGDQQLRTRVLQGHNEALLYAVQSLAQDNDVGFGDEIYAKGSEGDPDFADKLEAMRVKLKASKGIGDPDTEADASIRVQQAADPLEQVRTEILAGNLNTPGRILSSLEASDKLRKSYALGDQSILLTPLTAQYEDQIMAAYTDSPAPVFNSQGYARTLAAFHSSLIDWEASHPNSTLGERIGVVKDLGEQLLQKPSTVKQQQQKPQAEPAQPQQEPPSDAVKPPANAPAEPDPNKSAKPNAQSSADPDAAPVAQASGSDASSSTATEAAKIKQLIQENPSLRDVPEALIRKYLPVAEQEVTEREAKRPFIPVDDSINTQLPHNTEQAILHAATAPGKGIEKIPGLERIGKVMPNVSKLIFHHTGGSGKAEGVVSTLNQRRLGVQYIMERDGTIKQTGPDGAREAHILDANDGSGASNSNAIGIEVIAKDNKDVTPEQRATGLRFIQAMQKRFPSIGQSIYGHGEVNKGHKEADEGAAIVSLYRKYLAPKRVPTS